MVSDRPTKILVIGNSSSNLQALVEILSPLADEILGAQDGKRGIELARSTRPDLILLDHDLPDSNSFEICRGLKASACTQEIPIIIIVGLEKKEERERYFQIGVVDYIPRL